MFKLQNWLVLVDVSAQLLYVQAIFSYQMFIEKYSKVLYRTVCLQRLSVYVSHQHASTRCRFAACFSVGVSCLSGLSAFTCAPEDHSMSCQRVNVGGDWRPKRADRQGILQHAAISEAARKSLAVLATACWLAPLARLPSCQAGSARCQRRLLTSVQVFLMAVETHNDTHLCA